MSPIEKINTEMQKKPDDLYTEIIGHYLIDRCSREYDAGLIGADGKTLSGAMGAVTEAARKKKHNQVAVLLPSEVAAAVDRYFGLGADYATFCRAMEMSVGSANTPRKVEDAGKALSLDLDSFL